MCKTMLFSKIWNRFSHAQKWGLISPPTLCFDYIKRILILGRALIRTKKLCFTDINIIRGFKAFTFITHKAQKLQRPLSPPAVPDLFFVISWGRKKCWHNDSEVLSTFLSQSITKIMQEQHRKSKNCILCTKMVIEEP